MTKKQIKNKMLNLTNINEYALLMARTFLISHNGSVHGLPDAPLCLDRAIADELEKHLKAYLDRAIQ